MIEITTPVGRLVSGHPMVSHPVTDTNTGQPKMLKDGVTPQVSFYVGLAIPKGAEQAWNQTDWGQAIYNEGVAAWPNGEYGMPTFAWKITDGDSQIPNKKGKKPCEREGWPGHWIIQASNGFAVKGFHRGKYDPSQQIQRKEEIKTGDYIRLVISVKGNNPSQSPGVYLNPSMFELYQAGVEIVTENAPDPQATFGAVTGALPANAQIDTNMVAPGAPVVPGAAPVPVATPIPTPGTAQATPGAAPAAPGPVVTPAPDFLAPGDFKVIVEGKPWLASALKAAGWDDNAINALPRV